MISEVIMPKAGIDMAEGEIVKWHKNEGDQVNEGEILLEIMTDKTSMEIEAEVSGYLLKILRKEGEIVPIAEVIAYIGDKGESIDGPKERNIEDMETAKNETVTEDQPSLEDSYNVTVIGGGPAGYVAAIKAAQLGAKVAIVEKAEFGGTCLNKGCIPTKTYLKNAEIIEGMRHAAERGINIADTSFSVDMAKLVKYKDGVVKKLTNGVAALLKSNGVDIYKGVGRINKNKNVVVNGKQIIKTDKVILAGGSKASRINIPGADCAHVLTSDDILSLTTLPKSLVVIGGGVIGVEMAQAYMALGTKVTIVEMAPRILAPLDGEVSATLSDILHKKGVEILTSVGVSEIVDMGDKAGVKLNDGRMIEGEKVLISIGRVPDLDGIGDVEFELEKGKIKVNNAMETSVKDIYAPGDVNGIKMLAHVAFRMGEVAAENAVKGTRKEVKLISAPSVVYTQPEVAMVGLTEERAREVYGDDIRIGKFNFAANGRALASDEAHGFVKVIVDKKYGEILGVHIIGPTAAEIINQASLLMELEITVNEVLNTIYGHPTYSEALYEACADSLGIAVHLPKKK